MATSFDSATMIDVASYGANPNDGKGDSLAIQAAENAALASGKSLYFDTGTYDVNSTVNLYSGIQIVSAEGAILEASGTNSTVFATAFAKSDDINSLTPVNNISISDVTFQGNNSLADPGKAASMVIAWRTNNIQFNDVTFQNTPRIGALMSDVQNSGFNGCTFNNIGYTEATGAPAGNDIFAQGVAFCSDMPVNSNNFVQNCSFSSIGLDALSATSQSNFSAESNTFTNLDVMAPSFWDSKSEGSAAIYLSNDTATTISQNTISGASGNGLDIIQSQGLNIVDNNISHSGGSGIILSEDSDVDVINNTITDNNRLNNHFFFQAGITVADHMWGSESSDSSNIYLDGNVISDDQATPTQNWALQINLEAHPNNLVIGPNNELLGNAFPGGVGSNGVAQAWVQPSNNTIQTAQDVSNGTPWSPNFVSTPMLTADLSQIDAVSSDGVEVSRTSELSGHAIPFFAVVLMEGGAVLGQTTADASGAWSLSPSVSDGEHNIVVQEAYTGGTIETQNLTVIVDSGLNPIRVWASSAQVESSGEIQNTGALVGTADPNTQISIYNGQELLGSTVSEANGVWSFTPVLSSGSYVLTASETNAQGYTVTAATNLDMVSQTSGQVAGVAGESYALFNTGAISGSSLSTPVNNTSLLQSSTGGSPSMPPSYLPNDLETGHNDVVEGSNTSNINTLTVCGGSTASKMTFVGSGNVSFVGGSGGASVSLLDDGNSVYFGKGPMDVEGSKTGPDSYYFHVGDGAQVVENFLPQKGDCLYVESALRSMLNIGSSGGGTLLSFGENATHSILLSQVHAFDPNQIKWLG